MSRSSTTTSRPRFILLNCGPSDHLQESPGPPGLGCCGPGKLPQKGKVSKSGQGRVQKVFFDSFGPTQESFAPPKPSFAPVQPYFAPMQEASCSQGPKDLLHPLLTTFGNFHFSGNFPGPQHPNSGPEIERKSKKESFWGSAKKYPKIPERVEKYPKKSKFAYFSTFSGTFLRTGCGFFAYSWKLPAYSGAFLLTVDTFSFFTYSWSFFAYSFSFLTYSCSFFAYSGKVRLIRALRDCKQRSATVSQKTPTVSKKLPLSKRGRRTEGVGARKSFLCQRFTDLFSAPFFQSSCQEKGDTILGTFLLCFGPCQSPSLFRASDFRGPTRHPF